MLIPIHGNTNVKSLLDHYPQAARVILRHGMACVGCDLSRFHTIEEIAVIYHLDPVTLLEEIRRSTNNEGTDATAHPLDD